MTERMCKTCGKVFYGHHKALYCCEECKPIRSHHVKKDKAAAATKVCDICGGEFSVMGFPQHRIACEKKHLPDPDNPKFSNAESMGDRKKSETVYRLPDPASIPRVPETIKEQPEEKQEEVKGDGKFRGFFC
jgi:hypothetical protein